MAESDGLQPAGPPAACPNCGHLVRLEYCPSCGQGVREWNLTLGAWLRRAASELLDLDGRAARTLGRLIARPGAATVDWVEGRRASYVAPTRLYLMASALLFGTLALPGVSVGVSAARGGIEGYLDSFERFGETAPEWLTVLAADEASMDRFAAAVFELLPRAMFLLLPLAALLMWVAFRRNRYYFVVHLVWCLHVHTVAFLTLLALLPLNLLRGTAKYAVAWPVLMGALLWLAWYVWRAAATTYERGMVRALLPLGTVAVVYAHVFMGVVYLMAAMSLRRLAST